MSGIHQLLLGSGNGIVSPLPGGLTYSETTAPGPATADLNVTSSGQITGTGATQGFTQNWFMPTTAGIGAVFWVRASLTGGTAPTGGTTGSWLQLNSSRQWTNTRSPLAGAKSSTFLIEIATDAAGANIVTSGTYDLQAILD